MGASDHPAPLRVARGELPRYVRQVCADRWQARPYSAADGRRVNLGTFPSPHEAGRAVRAFLAGRFDPRPRFVRRAATRRGVRYYGLVPRAAAVGFDRVPGLFETQDEAGRAVRRFLEERDGAPAAARLLAPPDESGRQNPRRPDARPNPALRSALRPAA